MDSIYNLLDSNSNKFYFNKDTKKKKIIYHIYKKYKGTYASHIEKKRIEHWRTTLRFSKY